MRRTNRDATIRGLSGYQAITRIPGGFRSFAEAIRQGYTEPMSNPCIRWSLSRGFTAESYLHDSDDDQFVIAQCNYDANSGGAWINATRSEYRIVRARCLAFQNCLAAGGTRDEAIDAADYARFELE